MTDDDRSLSNRARKRIVDGGVRRLLNTPGWNPFKAAVQPADASTKVADALHVQRLQNAGEAAAICAECAARRLASGDSTDLCPRHLAQAMGIG